MSRIPEQVELNNKYLDLGLAVEGLNMAAGAIVNGNWIDNVEWVRNIIFMTQSDQQSNIIITRRDKSGTVDWGTTLANIGATSNAWAGSVTTAPLGYSIRISVKNSAAVANTYARIRVQLLGL